MWLKKINELNDTYVSYNCAVTNLVAMQDSDDEIEDSVGETERRQDKDKTFAFLFLLEKLLTNYGY